MSANEYTIKFKRILSWRGSLVFTALLCLCAEPVLAQRVTKLRAADSELLNYIQNETTDPACGACLDSAKKYFEKKQGEALAQKIAGMARIAQGEHFLGSPADVGEPDEHPAEKIYLSAFYVDKTEVTIGQYVQFARVTADNYPEWMKPGGKFDIASGSDGYYKRLTNIIKNCDACPVFGVTWENAAAYCRWKNKRLPTEAEWEAAARAGSNKKFSFGDIAENAGAYSWNETNSSGFPHPAGSKKPNNYGLYDMHGNVWEWVDDFYDKARYSGRAKANPPGPRKGDEHVIRGGSWALDLDSLRSANRASTSKANDDIGFRCAVSEKVVLEQ